MKASDIRVGDTLRLKSDNRYGMGSVLVPVTAIQDNPGYKVPWIISDRYDNGRGGAAAFRPSDFAKREEV